MFHGLGIRRCGTAWLQVKPASSTRTAYDKPWFAQLGLKSRSSPDDVGPYAGATGPLRMIPRSQSVKVTRSTGGVAALRGGSVWGPSPAPVGSSGDQTR